MPGSTSTKTTMREEVQDALDNLRRNLANTQDPKRKRQYNEMIARYLRRYDHLGVQ